MEDQPDRAGRSARAAIVLALGGTAGVIVVATEKGVILRVRLSRSSLNG